MERIYSNKLCDYGCGNIAKFKFNNGKLCCEKYHSRCPVIKTKNKKANKNRIVSDKTKKLMRNSKLGNKNPMYGKKIQKNKRIL